LPEVLSVIIDGFYLGRIRHDSSIFKYPNYLWAKFGFAEYMDVSVIFLELVDEGLDVLESAISEAL
jgi:hypothetical protein